MIDDSDGDAFWLISMLTSGPVSMIFFIIAVVFWFYSCQNKKECEQMNCPDQMTPKLTDHECICIFTAK